MYLTVTKEVTTSQERNAVNQPMSVYNIRADERDKRSNMVGVGA